MAPTVAEVLRQARERRGLSQAEAAALVGMTQPQLSKLERGVNVPGVRMLERFAYAYDTTLSGLLSGDIADVLSQAGPVSDGMPAGRVAEERGSYPVVPVGDSIERYVSDVELVRRTLRTLPSGSDGIPIKLALLNAVEAAAAGRAVDLPAEFFLLRREVMVGDL